MLRTIISLRVLLSASITLAVAYTGYKALDYMYLAKVFPLSISILLLIFCLINLVRDILHTHHRVESTGVGAADLGTEWDIPLDLVWKRFGYYLLLLLLLYGGILLVGYVISITVFVILFYWRITKAGLFWSIVGGAAALVFISVVDKLLFLGWPSGLLQEYVRLPWPFN